MAVALQLERDRAYLGLLDLILGGGVNLVAPLSERKLADSLDIGRTPVREALRDLARDGILEVQPARGTFVRPLSIEDVQEIYEVRYSLEGVAAQRLIRDHLSKGLDIRTWIFKNLAEYTPDARVLDKEHEA